MTSSDKAALLRRAVFLSVRMTGIPFLLREFVQRNRVTILCYHEPSATTFKRHLKVLLRRYNLIPLERYLKWRCGEDAISLPQKALVLTFDDGHRSNFRLLHLLKELKVPVTIFLCSAIVGTHRHFWWKHLNQVEVEKLKRDPDRVRLTVLSQRQLDEDREYPVRDALSADEIRELGEVADLQSHSRFHPILPACDDTRAFDEIARSRRELQDRFGVSADVFAYPNGDYETREVRLVREAGYRGALTIDGGYNTRETDLFRLRRIRMFDDADTNELIVKASGLWCAWEWLIQRRRRSVRTVRDVVDANMSADPNA